MLALNINVEYNNFKNITQLIESSALYRTKLSLILSRQMKVIIH